MNNKTTRHSLAILKNSINYLCLATLFLAGVTHHIKANENESASYKTFEIVIPSFNNERWAEANLRSVCFQNYPKDKYHITYVNDASTDKTEEIVTTFIKNNHLETRVTLINNMVNKGQLENRYRAFHNLPNTTIIAECDGDDFYAHNDVLKELNDIYQNPNTWMLYTLKFKQFPQNKLVSQSSFTPLEIAQNAFRNFWGRPTISLRSYYAWLFKQIKLKDLLYQGRFYPVLTDPSYMIPMLEMAGEHNQYVNKVLYLYNTTNPLSVRKKYGPDFRKNVYDDISNKTPYNRLVTPIITEPSQPELIICCSTIAALDSLIATAQAKLSDFSTCQVFLELKNGPETDYKPSVQLPFNFRCTTYDARNNSLQKILQNHLTQSTSKAIALITKENVAIDNRINLTECVNTLTDSFATVFYLHNVKDFSQTQAPRVQIKSTVWAGQFNYLHPYHRPGALLCTKDFLLARISAAHIDTLDELNKNIASWATASDDVFLFFHNEDKD